MADRGGGGPGREAAQAQWNGRGRGQGHARGHNRHNNRHPNNRGRGRGGANREHARGQQKGEREGNAGTSNRHCDQSTSGKKAIPNCIGRFVVIVVGYSTDHDKQQREKVVHRLLNELRKDGRKVKDVSEGELTAPSMNNMLPALDGYRALTKALGAPLDYAFIFEPVPSTRASNTVPLFMTEFGPHTKYFCLCTREVAQIQSMPEIVDEFCEKFRNVCHIRDEASENQSKKPGAARVKKSCKAISSDELLKLYELAKAKATAVNGQCAVLEVVLHNRSLLARMHLCKDKPNFKDDSQLLYLAQLYVIFMQDKLLVAVSQRWSMTWFKTNFMRGFIFNDVWGGDFISEVLECGFIEHYTSTYIDEMEFILKREADHSAAQQASETVQYVITLMTEALKMSPYKNASFLKGSMGIVRTLCAQDFVTDNEQFWNCDLKNKFNQLLVAREQQAELIVAPVKKDDGMPGKTDYDRLSETVLPDFREIPIEPTVHELKSPSRPPLQPNRATGAYNDSEHYLNVQFHLLREDFVGPLRDAIKEHMSIANLPEDARPRRTFSNIVYSDVQLLMPKYVQQKGLFVRELEFTVDSNVKFMKRLLYGSLVALSDDDFKSRILLATIEDRDDLMQQPEEPSKGGKQATKKVRLGVSMSSSEQLNLDSRYVMVESPAYFEAYKHVLMGLKRMPKGQPIPFEKFLVRCDDEIERPKYQRRTPWMDLSCLLKRPDDDDDDIQNMFPRQSRYRMTADVADLNNDGQWPSAADLGLDSSQLAALRLALRSELAVIQGPPGTGKTFIGYKITQALLENRESWNQEKKHPILVVCLTNHALDQFLEGCLKFTQNIIRVGSRCKNVELQPYNLSEVRRKPERTQVLPPDLRKAITECWQELNNIEQQLKRASQAGSQAEGQSHLLHPSALYELMGHLKTDLSTSNAMCQWLRPHKRLMPVQCIRSIMAQFQNTNSDELCDERTAKLAACIYREFTTKHKEQDLARMLMYDPEQLGHFVTEEVLNIVTSWPTLEDLKTLTDSLLARLKKAGSEFAECSCQQLEKLLLYFDCDQKGLLHILLSKQYDQAHAERLREQAKQNRAIAVANEVKDSAVAPRSNLMKALDTAADEDRMLDDDELATAMVSEHDVHDIVNTARNNPTINVHFGNDAFMQLTSAGTDCESHVFEMQQPNKLEQNIKFLTDNELFTLLITYAPPMTYGQFGALRDTFDHNDLDLPTRWALYKRWVQKYREQLQVYIHQLGAAYKVQRARQRTVHQLRDMQILTTADILGMTTNGAANYQQLLQRIRPRIVIMEEAAEVLEAHIVASLNDACEQLILIGDHKQLRPNPQVYDLAKKFNMDVSLFERLINNKLPYETLSAQHRMRPEMSGTLIKRFYENLTDHESTRKLPTITGVTKSMLFLTHIEFESADHDTLSHANKYEAAWACELCVHLIKQEYKGSKITILCAYSAQMFEVKKQLQQHEENLYQVSDVEVKVVDNYQGEENDIVILSLVRSNKNGKIGFLSVPNRVCVALSRARHGIFILGNLDFLVEHCVLWKEIADSLNKKDCVQRGVTVTCFQHNSEQFINHPQKFKELAPEGGCQQLCNYRLSCGHCCSSICHAYDPAHEKARCSKQCPRKCKRGHNCQMRCFECDPSCAPCMKLIDKKLPCGHTKELQCHEPRKLAQCESECNKQLECGHKCKLPCYRICNEEYCREQVNVRKASCGHVLKIKCKDRHLIEEKNCKHKMTKTWPYCGHECETECHVDVHEVACPQPCAQPLPDCGHSCSGTCGICKQGRLHVKCKEDCRRLLVCGHECTHKCGGAGCPPCDEPCATQCTHSRCVTKYATKTGKHRTCGELCQPCQELCGWNCEHQQCVLKCNEPCTRPVCNERCGTQLNCGEGHVCAGACNGLHSQENCPTITVTQGKKNKKVYLCAVCHPKEWAQLTEIFFGHESDDAAFIQLEDCGCIFECTGLDGYVQSKADDTTEEIVQLKCPRCQVQLVGTVPLRSGRRFGAMLKQRIIDIEKVKSTIIGKSIEQLEGGRQILCVEIKQTLSGLHFAHPPAASVFPPVIENFFGARTQEPEAVEKHNHARIKVLMIALKHLNGMAERRTSAQLSVAQLSQWRSLLTLLHNCRQSRPFEMRTEINRHCEKRSNVKKIDFEHLQALAARAGLITNISKNVNLFNSDKETEKCLQEPQMKWIKYTRKMFDVWSEFTNLTSFSPPQSVVEDLTWLINWMVTERMQMSNSQVQQINQILNQLELLAVLATACSKSVIAQVDINNEQCLRLRALLDPLYSSRPFTEDTQKLVTQQLDAFMNSLNQPATAVQRLKVAKALGFDAGHWYKCGQCGEVYAIGECGGAMATGKCAKCKAPIGGTRHRLLRTNTRADDLMVGRDFYD